MKLRLLPHLKLSLLCLILAQGCSSTDLATPNLIDPSGGLTREDYLALRNRTPSVPQPEAKTPPPIPDMPSDDDGDGADGMNASLDRLVSLNVTDNVPVRDVLMELVRKTGANLELDPRVQGSVILSAHDQPFGQVLKRICALANLRYKVNGTFIHIEPDTAYQKSYRLDYLSLSRKTSSDTSIATNVFDVDVGSNGTNTTSSSGTGGGTSSATQNNSTAKISALSEADFWAETSKSIAQILDAGNKQTDKATFSINKQAGMVTVYGTERQQDAIDKYFAILKRKSYAQVLIDARIIEVELDDTYQAGIDWTAVFNNASVIATNLGPQAALNTNGFFTAGVTGTNFNAIVSLVETFGTTRVLSAPRVTVLNNQTAVMKVATNQVYFITQAQFTTTTNANGSSVTTNPVYTSTPHTVPVGLVMTVQPAIDAATNRVTMTLRPTISRIVSEVNDPSISLNAAVAGVSTPVQSQIPVLAVREMDSVIQLHSGEIAVMGGLMQDSSINTDQGVPILDEIPYIGNLFKTRDNNGKTSELVILLRATISDQPPPDRADKNLYRIYNKDPRPMVPDANAQDDDTPPL